MNRLTLLFALASGPALASGSVEGTLTVTKGGQPASAKYTLIHLEGFSTPAPHVPAEMNQLGRTFQPPVLPVIKGQWVKFLNQEVDGT